MSQSFAMDPCSSPRAVRSEGAEKSASIVLGLRMDLKAKRPTFTSLLVNEMVTPKPLI